MSKRSKTNRNGKPPSAPTRKLGLTPALFIAVLVVGAAVLGYGFWKSKQPSTAVPQPTEVSSTNTQSVVSIAKPDFQKLKGRWLRPDGGYVIEVKSIADDGAMDAAYYNPRPIHVGKAEASLDGAIMKVFVELRDANYPGSTYTLAYDTAGDQLKGIYYQALQQQQYEVFFVRAQ